MSVDVVNSVAASSACEHSVKRLLTRAPCRPTQKKIDGGVRLTSSVDTKIAGGVGMKDLLSKP